MDGNKPKQQHQKPVDNTGKNQINFDQENLEVPLVPMLQAAAAKEAKYRPAQSFFTKKRMSRAKKKIRRKIARKSRQINRRRAA